MPPKVKITKEAILAAAIEILREKGISGINARDIAKSLGCSVQPIFRCFQNMDRLKAELYQKAENIFEGYLDTGPQRHRIPFLGIGLAYVAFAKEEKNLFKLIFMSDGFHGRSITDIIHNDSTQATIHMAADAAGLNMADAARLFGGVWLTTHGIASMVATNVCDFSNEQIAGLLTDSFLGLKHRLGSQGEHPIRPET